MISAILFDLGDTLIYHPAPWRPNMELAARALAQTTCTFLPDCNPDTVSTLFFDKLAAYMTEREQSQLERTTFQLMQTVFAELGVEKAPDAHVRAALDAFYAITQTNWEPEIDTLPTLQALHAKGYRLGIVSNAGDDKDVRQLVQKTGTAELMDFILTSAACGIRKPHPEIFRRALAHWSFLPSEVMMVGDRLDADVLGANRLGIISTWIKRRSRQSANDPNAPQPAFTISALHELPSLIEQINASSKNYQAHN